MLPDLGLSKRGIVPTESSPCEAEKGKTQSPLTPPTRDEQAETNTGETEGQSSLELAAPANHSESVTDEGPLI